MKAVDLEQSGQLVIRKASEVYEIPKSTTADRISGKISLTVTRSRPLALRLL